MTTGQTTDTVTPTEAMLALALKFPMLRVECLCLTEPQCINCGWSREHGRPFTPIHDEDCEDCQGRGWTATDWKDERTIRLALRGAGISVQYIENQWVIAGYWKDGAWIHPHSDSELVVAAHQAVQAAKANGA